MEPSPMNNSSLFTLAIADSGFTNVVPVTFF